MEFTRVWRIGAVALSLTALLAGCGRAASEPGHEAGAAGESYVEGMVPQGEGGEPRDGGSITIAGNVEPRTLDPAATQATGATGGTEMSNIFGTLARYDSESKAVVPFLAESITPNDDSSVFTIKLRDGVEFSDGTPLDAEAVKWSMDRYANSKSAPEGVMWHANVDEVSVVDDHTVEVALKQPYPGFVNMLGTGPGMIVAKASDAGETFAPVGAGPFTLAEMNPGEGIELEANPDYWAGEPKLDEVRFVYLVSPDAAVEAQAQGDVQVVLLSQPALVEKMLVTEGRKGYLDLTSSWAVSIINSAEGRPGNDPRVRKALSLALDPQVMTDRAYGGVGNASPRLIAEGSRWYSKDVEVNDFDAEKAKQLVDEAKADGFDGKITYISSPDQSARDSALALKAQWDAVGFDVEVEVVRTTADLVTKGVSEDYDVMRWGMGIRDQDPYQKLLARMHSSGNQLYGTHTSPEMDALIEDFRNATSEDEGKQAMAEIEAQFQKDVPFITHMSSWEYLEWDDTLRDVTGGSQVMVMFDKAYLTD